MSCFRHSPDHPPPESEFSYPEMSVVSCLHHHFFPQQCHDESQNDHYNSLCYYHCHFDVSARQWLFSLIMIWKWSCGILALNAVTPYPSPNSLLLMVIDSRIGTFFLVDMAAWVFVIPAVSSDWISNKQQMDFTWVFFSPCRWFCTCLGGSSKSKFSTPRWTGHSSLQTFCIITSLLMYVTNHHLVDAVCLDSIRTSAASWDPQCLQHIPSFEELFHTLVSNFPAFTKPKFSNTPLYCMYH